VPPFENAYAIKSRINIALGIRAVVGDEVFLRASEVRNRHLSDSYIEVFNAASVSAHVEKVEVVDVDIKLAIISLSHPEVGGGIRCKNVADFDECFSKTKLVSTGEVR
jgi:hypothetical protein